MPSGSGGSGSAAENSESTAPSPACSPAQMPTVQATSPKVTPWAQLPELKKGVPAAVSQEREHSRTLWQEPS